MLPLYDIIGWPEARALTSEADSQFIRNIEYNNGMVYLLTDGTYVIMPINPFAKCLSTSSKSLLDEWISTSCYPTNEAFNIFYFTHKEKIKNIPLTTTELINQLSVYTKLDLANLQHPTSIDDAHRILKKKRSFNKYQLNFIVLVGAYILNKYPDDRIYWAKLVNKQFLNPLTEVVLAKVIDGEERYFNINYSITGKWGYSGITSIAFASETGWLRPNEIVTLERL